MGKSYNYLDNKTEGDGYNPYPIGSPSWRIMARYLSDLKEHPNCDDDKHPGCDQCQPMESDSDINPDDEDDNYGY